MRACLSLSNAESATGRSAGESASNSLLSSETFASLKNWQLAALSRRQYKQLLVIQELYRQQRLVYTKQVHHVEDRIVSIHQLHIRPIVRGKAKAKVEFGAKVSVSMVQGFAFL